MRPSTRQSVSALIAATAVLGLPAANAVAAGAAVSPATAKAKAAAARAAAAKVAAAKAAAAKAAAAKAAGRRTVVGETAFMERWGPVTVTLVVENGKVVEASAELPLEKARSNYINSRVAPYLNAQVVQIQSAQIDLIGGATQSCDAYAKSLQSALDKARIKATATR